MEINEELNRILAVAFADARSRTNEYLTPEHLFYASLLFETGAAIISQCGANVELLKKELETYLNEKVPKAAGSDPVSSLGFQELMEQAIVHTISAEKKELGNRRYLCGATGRKGIVCRLPDAAPGNQPFQPVERYYRRRGCWFPCC